MTSGWFNCRSSSVNPSVFSSQNHNMSVLESLLSSWPSIFSMNMVRLTKSPFFPPSLTLFNIKAPSLSEDYLFWRLLSLLRHSFMSQTAEGYTYRPFDEWEWKLTSFPWKLVVFDDLHFSHALWSKSLDVNRLRWCFMTDSSFYTGLKKERAI